MGSSWEDIRQAEEARQRRLEEEARQRARAELDALGGDELVPELQKALDDFMGRVPSTYWRGGLFGVKRLVLHQEGTGYDGDGSYIAVTRSGDLETFNLKGDPFRHSKVAKRVMETMAEWLASRGL